MCQFLLKILFNPSRLCPGGGAVAQCAMTKKYMLQVSNWSLSRMYKSSPLPTKVIFKQKLPRIHLHSQRQCTWRIIAIFRWTEGKLNWSVKEKSKWGHHKGKSRETFSRHQLSKVSKERQRWSWENVQF